MTKNKSKKVNRTEFLRSSIRFILLGLFAISGVRLVSKKTTENKKMQNNFILYGCQYCSIRPSCKYVNVSSFDFLQYHQITAKG